MSKSYKNIALLPLKANSTRVPGKNFNSLANKPLFRYILDSLLAVSDIELIVINTDARSILLENGLQDTDRIMIRDRRPEICGDTVSMNRILEDDVNAVNAQAYLMTHVTNPLLGAATIRQALNIYHSAMTAKKNDSLFSVNKVQARFYHHDGRPINHDPNNLIPTQNLEPWYEENSCLYIFSRDSFKNTNARIGKNPILFEISPLEAVDIDEPHDWQMAEALVLYFQQQSQHEHQDGK